MSIKRHAIAKYNYTGRRRIKQKPDLIEITQLGRNADSARVKVAWNRDAILEDVRIERDVAADLVLDVLFLGNTRRFELTDGDKTTDILISDCPDNAILDFRLKLVATSDAERGRLIAASSEIKLHSGQGDKDGAQVTKGFFDPELSDSLESQIFVVSWPADDDPRIFLNKEYHHKFFKTPAYAAHLFPEIVRRVVTGILLRNDDLDVIEEGCAADSWLLFVQQQLGIQLRGEEADLADSVADKLRLVDQIVETFANRKWRGEKTLLDAML